MIISLIPLFIGLATLVLFIIYAVDTRKLAKNNLTIANETSLIAETSIISVKILTETLAEYIAARDVQVAPFIFVFLENIKGKDLSSIYLVVKNCGKGVARDIKVTFVPELKPSEYISLEHIKQMVQFIPTLPPDAEIRHKFASTLGYINKPETPLEYEVNIKFSGGIGNREREFNQKISLLFFTKGMRANRISRIPSS